MVKVLQETSVSNAGYRVSCAIEKGFLFPEIPVQFKYLIASSIEHFRVSMDITRNYV